MEEFRGINDIIRVLSHPTWDLILVFTLLAAGFFYGISTGKKRIAATLIYTYAAVTISSVIPLEKLSELLETEIFLVKAGVFTLIFLLLAWLLGSRRARGAAPAGAWWQIFLLSFLQVGLLIHTIFSFFPKEKVALLAPLTRIVFANPDFHLWWIVAPIGILIILKRLETNE